MDLPADEAARADPRAELLRYVGPPILDSFRDLAGFDAETSLRALDIYRVHYLEFGVFDATVYPGIPELLREIHDRGMPLSLATSKPEHPATLILEAHDLRRYFTVITGASRGRGAQREEGRRRGGPAPPRREGLQHPAPRS